MINVKQCINIKFLLFSFFFVREHYLEMATIDHVLPTEEELTVPEVSLSSASLRAGAFHMGKYCENQNNVRAYCFELFCCLLLRNFL